jgi:hypothetical protein
MNKILDNYLVEAYPRIFSERSKSPMESCMGRGFECGNGWFPIIDALCNNIQTHIDDHNKYRSDEAAIDQMVFLQVKEKFGGLRIYASGGDAYCHGLISMTETLSYRFCEICGKAGYLEVGHTSGWIQSVCIECAKKSKRKIKFDKEITSLLKKAIKQDHKKIFEFYANR